MNEYTLLSVVTFHNIETTVFIIIVYIFFRKVLLNFKVLCIRKIAYLPFKFLQKDLEYLCIIMLSKLKYFVKGNLFIINILNV